MALVSGLGSLGAPSCTGWAAHPRTPLELFSAPPALPVTDAAVLATQADGVLMVADAGKTRRSAARQAVEGLRKMGVNLLGVVVNRLPLRGSGG